MNAFSSSNHSPFAWLLCTAACLAHPGMTASAADPAPALAAGTEVSVPLPATDRAMKVYLPSNHAPGRKWPVIFFYHGMGGAPTTALLRKLTGGRDCIVVGMPYLSDRITPLSPQEREDSRKAELEAFRRARTWIVGQAGADDDAVFLAGTSKGGWAVSTLWEREASRLAGVVILLAGRQPGPDPGAAAMRGKPVYIGAGEDDPNLLPALQARQHYRQNGALVCFDVFAGIGHQTPDDLPRLRAWLKMNLPPGPGPEDRERLRAEYAGEIQTALAGTGVLEQFRRLQALSDDPRLSLCDPAVLAPARARFAELKQISPAKEEWQAEARLGEVSVREERIRSLAEMKSVLDEYQAIARGFPDTRCGALPPVMRPRWRRPTPGPSRPPAPPIRLPPPAPPSPPAFLHRPRSRRHSLSGARGEQDPVQSFK
ncbi:MAG: hypothetical protein U1F77_06760 [Kiritimatiellia bacterium]